MLSNIIHWTALLFLVDQSSSTSASRVLNSISYKMLVVPLAAAVLPEIESPLTDTSTIAVATHRVNDLS